MAAIKRPHIEDPVASPEAIFEAFREQNMFNRTDGASTEGRTELAL